MPRLHHHNKANAKQMWKGKPVELPSPPYRPGTYHPQVKANYMISRGGLGDYINQMTALVWLAEQNPHYLIRVWCTEPFHEVANFIMKPHSNVTVIDPNTTPMEDVMGKGEICTVPARWPQYINPVGAHLMDLGYMFFAQQQRAPENGQHLPDLTHYKSGREWNLPARYAIMTPGYTAPARVMPPDWFNHLSNYLVEKGVTPVYLGKRQFTTDANFKAHPDYFARIDKAIDMTNGIDLTEQTTLLESVEIIRDATMILGVDNGLLHFAGCTNTPIIFGHTVTTVEHRRVRRPKGITIDLTIPQNILACSGCQSRTRGMPAVDYKYCMYNDYECVNLLFRNGAKEWKDSIDFILNSYK